MRLVLALLVVVTVLMVIWLVTRRDRREDRRAEILSPTEIDRAYLARDMARFLDRSLDDPLARTDSGWEDEARRLVATYYEGTT